ncbi:MAG: OmpA family protein [Deltaproteobacteria bacterium]|nr:OmpA family protein [Deltaproteobacteria bacterium]
MLFLLLAARALAAEGDSGVDFELFKPHADFYGYSAVPGGATLQHLQLGGGVWFDFSDDPVVMVDANGERVSPDGTDSDGLVNSRASLHAQVGVGITRFGSLTVDMPFVVAQDGFAVPSLGATSVDKVAPAGAGDLVVTPRAEIIDRDYLPVGLAVSVPVGLPTGNAEAMLGEGAVSVAPQATFEWSDGQIHTRAYKFRAAASGGLLIRERARIKDTSIGNAFLYGVAAGWHLAQPTEITLELHGNSVGAKASQNAAELLLGAKLFAGDFVAISAGGGTGLGGGVGAPDFRVYAGVGIAPSLDPANRDTDRDNIRDGDDKCPRDAEDMDGYQDKDGCPELDNDADGREDQVDKCPNDPEDDDGYLDNDGCPEADNDKDGVADADDQCPNEAGPAELAGCPNRDTDGDGMGDDLDRCPYDAEDFDGDRDEDGCPEENSRVVVEKNFIRINDVIYFDTNKTSIQERSYDLVDEIAKVVNENPQILKIRIEGHTDDVGGDMQNFKLSQGRAKAVLDYLVSRGVDPSRLQSAGFGESMPLVANDSEANRAKNRRVEFVIVDQR